MSADFYRAFEDRYRGSRETIKSRLRVYLPFVHALRDARPDTRAIDLGCGRGEWLELLKESGIRAAGFDLDEGMLDACRAAGLDAGRGDALASLKSSPGGSWDIVSGFHLVEHLPFAELQELIGEALRVLRPGGLLILETPNPENLAVGTANFYMDPTHLRPVPPALLVFLPEHHGFSRVKILRLQELPSLAEGQAPSLLNVLRDVSPDYAVVAQKAPEGDRLAALDEPFAREYGLTLEALAMRYDAAVEARIRAAAENAHPLRWITRLFRKGQNQ